MGRAMEQTKMEMGHGMAKSPFTTRSPVPSDSRRPGESAVSALLADRGYDVVMLEKGTPPALPYRRIFIANEYHDHTSHFYFTEAMDKSFPYAVHVRRSLTKCCSAMLPNAVCALFKDIASHRWIWTQAKAAMDARWSQK